jgi:Zn-dependent protease with chaperone function
MEAMQCANVVVPQASELAMRYYSSGNILWIVGQCLGWVLPLLFFIKGFSGRLSSVSHRYFHPWFLGIAVYLVCFVCIYAVLDLPFDFYLSYVREHAYGLSNQSLSKWFADYGKGIIFTIVGCVAFIWIFYLLLEKSPRRWWMYSSLVSIGICFITSFIQPIWIDPFFSKFTSMQDKALEEKILKLARRAGIEHGRVFQVNKSEDTNQLNAYVTGLGKTKRIVLWDTTLKKMTPDQILFVMGHEMGHYVLKHIWWYFLYFSVFSFVLFYLMYLSANFIMKHYHQYLGFKHLHNIASLPLLLFLLTVFTFFSLPLFNYFSRYVEHEADRFGLEVTGKNQAAGEAFIVLQQENLVNPRPGPLYKIWRSSHPPLAERVEFANSYCPWKQNTSCKYEKYFKE